MVLLLLGLAFVLATSSSLLATSGSGRGDNGGNSQPTPDDFPDPGEISGSISLSALGELWLTTYVDMLSILSKIEVVDVACCSLEYKLRIVGIATLDEELAKVFDIEEEDSNLEIQFRTPEEATEKLVAMVKALGIGITEESLRAIPCAVHCGWRSPEDCKNFIQNTLEENAS